MMALSSVDLPAFGRPTSVTKPDRKPSSRGRAAFFLKYAVACPSDSFQAGSARHPGAEVRQEHRGRHGQSTRARTRKHSPRRAVLRPPRQFANIRGDTRSTTDSKAVFSVFTPRTSRAMHRITARPGRARRAPPPTPSATATAATAGVDLHVALRAEREREPAARAREGAHEREPRARMLVGVVADESAARAGLRLLQPVVVRLRFLVHVPFPLPAWPMHAGCDGHIAAGAAPRPRRGLMPLRPSRRASPTPPGSRPRASP